MQEKEVSKWRGITKISNVLPKICLVYPIPSHSAQSWCHSLFDFVVLCCLLNGTLTGMSEKIRGVGGGYCDCAVQMQCRSYITDKQSHLSCAH